MAKGKKRIISVGTIVTLCVIALLVVGALIAIQYFKEVKESSSDYDEVMFPHLYSGSRYFFRTGYPDEWQYNEGKYGFYLDEATNKVVEFYPTEAELKEGVSEEDSPDRIRVDGVTLTVYCKTVDNSTGEYTPESVMEEFLSNIDGDREYVFDGNREVYKTDNVTFCKSGYSYYIDGVTRKCTVFTAVRSMEYYVIVTEIKGFLMNKYQSTLDGMVADFRFSVFDD